MTEEDYIYEAFDHANKFKAGELTGKKIIEAVKSNNADEVKQLMKLSAEDGGLIIFRLTQKDKDGRTALQIAEANNYQTKIGILRGQNN